MKHKLLICSHKNDARELFSVLSSNNCFKARYFGSFLKSFILSIAGSFIFSTSGTFDSVSADSILLIRVLNGPSAQTDCIPVDVKATHSLI